MSNTHSYLAASAAPYWRLCSGRPWMEQQHPELANGDEGAEGDAAHWLMATPKSEATIAPNGQAITETMRQGVAMFWRHVEIQNLAPGTLRVEERMEAIPRVHPTHNGGTPDARGWAFAQGGRLVLHIFDLKYGYRRHEVFEHDQLIDYAAGALTLAPQEAPCDPATLRETDIDVHLHIIQPRAYHPDGPVRTWKTTAVLLRPYIERLAAAAHAAVNNPVCTPHPTACEHCSARYACDALQQAAYRGMDIAQKPTPRVLSDAAAGLELVYLKDAAALMDARISGLEELVKHRLTQGARVPHWAYGPGQSSLKWTKSGAEVQVLGGRRNRAGLRARPRPAQTGGGGHAHTGPGRRHAAGHHGRVLATRARSGQADARGWRVGAEGVRCAGVTPFCAHRGAASPIACHPVRSASRLNLRVTVLTRSKR